MSNIGNLNQTIFLSDWKSIDRNYLQKAYTLKEKFRRSIENEDDGVEEKNYHIGGAFLDDSNGFYLIKHLYTDIFECGKQLTLLRLCSPKVRDLILSK